MENVRRYKTKGAPFGVISFVFGLRNFIGLLSLPACIILLNVVPLVAKAFFFLYLVMFVSAFIGIVFGIVAIPNWSRKGFSITGLVFNVISFTYLLIMVVVIASVMAALSSIDLAIVYNLLY